MNWSAVVRSVLHTKSVANAATMFLAGFGAGALFHAPARWSVYVGLGAVIANQLGLHQSEPGK